MQSNVQTIVVQSIYTSAHLQSIGKKRPTKRSEVEIAKLAAELRRSSVLAHLDAASLNNLARDTRVEVHSAGATILRQGDVGTCMHVIVAGQVLIMIQEQREQGDKEVQAGLLKDWLEERQAADKVGNPIMYMID
jgi:hypothetical protein